MTTEPISRSCRKLLDQEMCLLINGQLTTGATSETRQSIDPATGSVVGTYPNASPADVDMAVAAAKAAQPGWAARPLSERQEIVQKIGQVLREHSADLGYIDTLDSGSVFSSMQHDAAWAADVIDNLSRSASEVKGEVTQLDANLHYTRRSPFGVVAKLLPFNHPIQAFGTGLAAPLLMGNCLVAKPSPHTPISALVFARLIKDIVPPGVINVVTGDNDRVSMPLVTHADVHRLAVTGSSEAGVLITQAAAPSLKNLTMELGGKNALIVFPDANPEFAADIAVSGMNFKCQSHSCSSTSRVLVHRSLKQPFLDALVERVKAVRVGLPTDSESGMGAISTRPLFERILGYIEAGKSEGAKLLIGGTIPEDDALKNGNFVTPAVFSDARPDMSIAQEEIYGPVITVLDWEDHDEMVSIANGVEYGLTAVLVTDDLETAHQTADALEVGYVEINGSVSYPHGSPYGGWKKSGNGREGNIDELLSYTQLKSVNVNFRKELSSTSGPKNDPRV